MTTTIKYYWAKVEFQLQLVDLFGKDSLEILLYDLLQVYQLQVNILGNNSRALFPLSIINRGEENKITINESLYKHKWFNYSRS